MAIPDVFLQYFGFEENVEHTPTTDELFDAEIREVLSELSTSHADTKEYQEAVRNFKDLTDAYQNWQRGNAEIVKANAMEQDGRRRVRDSLVSNLLPKLASMCVFGATTIFWICLERERPLPMKLVQEANALLTPRGL